MVITGTLKHVQNQKVDCWVFNGTFSIKQAISCHKHMKYILFQARGGHSNINKQHETKIRKNSLFSLAFVKIISLPQISILGGVVIAKQRYSLKRYIPI